MAEVRYLISPAVGVAELNALFEDAWPDGGKGAYEKVLERSLCYVCAYEAGRLVGFVNVAWDGGGHAFLLDTTVHPDFRRRGIGTRLVREAAAAARERGAQWLHVDFAPDLEGFYRRAGFAPATAGLIDLHDSPGR